MDGAHEENSFCNSKSIDMKTKIRYRYLATRGGYVSVINQLTEVDLQVDITQELHVGERGDPIQAVPKESTIFSGWSDGVKSNPRIDTGSKKDYPIKEIIANFQMKYTLWERLWIWLREITRR